MQYFRGLTLQEALEMAYDESEEMGNVRDIFIEPPESHILTDEDSADEDTGGLIDNLSSRQLSAPAEIVLSDNSRIGGTDEPTGIEHTNNTQEMEIDREIESNQGQMHEHDKTHDREVDYTLMKVRKPEHFSFCQLGDLEPPKHIFPEPDYSKYCEMNCVQLFELFFSDDLLQKILVEISRYALFKNCPDLSVSISEMKVFLAILLLSGYNNLPSKRSYWENSSDMKNILVSEGMRRDRFLQICRFVHFADSSALDAQDKMFKLRLLTDTLKEKFQEHFIPEPNLAYDESMIRYFGRHGCKQFIRGKPVRFGYKVWSLNTPSGYLVNFEIYQGKNPRMDNKYEELFGKAAAPLIHMLEELAEKRCHGYNIFFDNLFTGMNLLSTLKANGYGATGTVRDNRIPKECPLVSKKDLMKRNRGDFSSALEKNSGVIFVRWMDNSPVTLASTCFGVAPIKNVERFSRKEKKKIFIPRPDVVLQYNKNMGGTDLMDGNIAW